MNKAIFLDRDGTLNIDKDYLYKIEDFEFLPDVVESLKTLYEEGYLLIVITNQSGIAKGYYSEDDLAVLHRWMKAYLQEQGVGITDILYCPHHPDAIVKKYKSDCLCRKPGIALFEQAIKRWDIDIDKSFAIGDRLRDLEICYDSLCKGILVGSRQEEIDILTQIQTDQIMTCDTLNDAVVMIQNKEGERVWQ